MVDILILAGDVSWVERKPRKSLIPFLNFPCIPQIQMLPLGNSYGDGTRLRSYQANMPIYKQNYFATAFKKEGLRNGNGAS